jgi:hypothetical protein
MEMALIRMTVKIPTGCFRGLFFAAGLRPL